jgi:hypothetical protein
MKRQTEIRVFGCIRKFKDEYLQKVDVTFNIRMAFQMLILSCAISNDEIAGS